MMIFVKLGIRNIFRNKRRSLLTCLAIGIAMGALIITDGFMEGMTQNMVKTATSGFLGHGQIHNRKYLNNKDSKYIIKNNQKLEKELNSNVNVKFWSKRVYSLGMISSPRNSRNVSLIGLDTKQEKKTTGITNYLIEGNFLLKEKEIVIGSKLKQKLGVELGSKVILTSSKVGSSEIVQNIYRIGGITSFGSNQTDTSMIFISLNDIQDLIKIGKNYHEIVLNLESPIHATNENLSLWKNLSSTDNIARSWVKIAPGLSSIVDMSAISIAIIGIIMHVLMGLIIFNTLFMAIFDRLFEFGLVRALGTPNKQLIITMICESTGLGVISSLFGIIIALFIGTLMAYYGIDYSGIEFNDIVFRDPIKFVFRLHQWILYPLITILFTVLVGIYPAIYTTKINLSKALKKTL